MKKQVEFRRVIEVEVDESKFTPEFMQEFRESFYQFRTLDDHIEHLAQLRARDIAGDFIEGYGPAKDFGIKFEHISDDTELVR